MKRDDFKKITKKHINTAKEVMKNGCIHSICIHCPLSSVNATNGEVCGVNYKGDRLMIVSQFLELFDKPKEKSLNFYERLSAAIFKKQILFKQDDGSYYNQRLDENMSKSEVKEWLLSEVGELCKDDN